MKSVKMYSLVLILAMLIAACGGAGGGEQTPGSGESVPSGVQTEDLGGSGEEIIPTESTGGIDGEGSGQVATLAPTQGGEPGVATQQATGDTGGAGSATQVPTGQTGDVDAGSATQPSAGSSQQGNLNPGIPVTGVQGGIVRMSELMGYSVESIGNLENSSSSSSGSGSASPTAQPTDENASPGSGSATQSPTDDTGGSGSSAAPGDVLGSVTDVLVAVGGSNSDTSMNSGAGDMGTTSTPDTGSSGSGSSGSGAGDMGSVGGDSLMARQQAAAYLILSADASYGFTAGQNLVAIPWNSVVGVDQTRQVILVNVSASRLQGFPAFGENNFPDMGTDGWDSSWRDYWGQE